MTRTIRRKLAGLLTTGGLVAASVALSGGTAHAQVYPETQITGAGSTFVLNMAEQWKADFKKQSNVTVNYTGVGSGAGRTQLINGTIDWAGSDVVASASETSQLNDKYGKFIYIPVIAGGIAIEYHVKGIGSGLKLDNDALADIFSGTLRYWDDKEIGDDNPGVKLPHQAIEVFVRSDKSGTSGVFTDFLNQVIKSKWKYGSTQQFPTDNGQIGKSGSDGVSNAVQASDGGIGYAEVSFAKERNLGIAQIRNALGTFEAPDSLGVRDIVDASPINKDGSLTMDYTAKVQGAYPIATVSYFVVPTSWPAKKLENFQAFMGWVLNLGQWKALSLGYSPLPQKLLTIGRVNVAMLKKK